MLDLIQTYWLYFLVGQYPGGPLGGLALTVLLAALALALALPVGLALGLARVSPYRAIRWPVTALVFVVRGIPLLMVIFWAYFFLPSVTGHKTEQFSTMLIALVLFDGVYLAEIVRAGIARMPAGQFESARALGLGYGRTMRLVILPQALRITFPPLLSQTLNLWKNTSIATVIGVAELMYQAQRVETASFRGFETFAVVTAGYLGISLLITGLAVLFQRRYPLRVGRS
jgi:polar amino acid transport system permease protein